MSFPSPAQPEDLAHFMDQMFSEMEGKFVKMTQDILGTLDGLGSRVQELERVVGDLPAQANPESAPEQRPFSPNVFLPPSRETSARSCVLGNCSAASTTKFGPTDHDV
jgi:heat shock factor-binding protein 1